MPWAHTQRTTGSEEHMQPEPSTIQNDAESHDSTGAAPAHRGSLIFHALVVSIITDQLMANSVFGDLIGLWIILILVSGGIWLWRIGIAPTRSAWLLIGLITGFATLTLIRQDVTSTLFSIAGGLLGGLWLATSYRDGRWMTGGLLTWSLQAVQLLWGLVSGGLATIVQLLATQPNVDRAAPRRRWTALPAILRGMALALPVLLVFVPLLARADPRYAERLGALWGALHLVSVETIANRLLWIGFVLLVLIGVYRHAAIHRSNAGIVPDAPALRFLGSIESSSMLGAVAVLFGSFLAVQVEYLFGGQALLDARGLRYADYARAGFAELVIVAVGTLVVLIGTSAVTRRDAPAEQRRFAVLFGAVATMVLVMLASAFQRLLLYEQAYGFTSERITAHIFMIWLALLFVVLIVLEASRRQRLMILACVIAVTGFAVSPGISNIDDLIVRQNVPLNRELDAEYLANLSSDAVPALAELMQDPATPAATRTTLQAVLACHRVRLDGQSRLHISIWRAQRILDSIAPQLAGRDGFTLPDGDGLVC